MCRSVQEKTQCAILAFRTGFGNLTLAQLSTPLGRLQHDFTQILHIAMFGTFSVKAAEFEDK